MPEAQTLTPSLLHPPPSTPSAPTALSPEGLAQNFNAGSQRRCPDVGRHRGAFPPVRCMPCSRRPRSTPKAWSPRRSRPPPQRAVFLSSKLPTLQHLSTHHHPSLQRPTHRRPSSQPPPHRQHLPCRPPPPRLRSHQPARYLPTAPTFVQLSRPLPLARRPCLPPPLAPHPSIRPTPVREPARRRPATTHAMSTPPAAGLTENAVAATVTGAAAGAGAAQTQAQQRLQRLLDAVARQEPTLRWAIGERDDGTTVLATDLASGWIPPHVEIPTGITLQPQAPDAQTCPPCSARPPSPPPTLPASTSHRRAQ